MRIAKHAFRRVSPAKFAEKIGLPQGWVVVRHSHVEGKASRRAVHGRWVAITSDKGTIFRIVRFSVNLSTDQIVMDWVGWIDLQGRSEDEADQVDLTISTASWCQLATIPFRHIDPGYRLSAWLGLISIALGALSVGLTLYLAP